MSYVCVKRHKFGFRLCMPTRQIEPQQTIPGETTSVLRDLLNAIPPEKNRKIFICLPRNRFYLRDIALPAMPIEDAVLSVQHSIRIYAHLPIESIHYDILFLPEHRTKGWTALVLYAERGEIQPWIDILRETGHEKNLRAIFPISIGVCGWLSLLKCPMPCGYVLPAEDRIEAGVCVKGGCRASYLLDPEDLAENGQRLDIRKKMEAVLDESAPLYHLDGTDEGVSEQLLKPIPTCRDLPRIWENPAVAALAPGWAGYQSISLNGKPVQPKIFPWWKLWAVACVLTIFACGLWSWQTQHRIDQLQARLKSVKEEYNGIEQQVRPLEKRLEKIQQAKVLIDDMQSFQAGKPKLFKWINEIAQLVPENTWFSRFTYSGTDMVLQGQSPEALKVLEAIRGSEMFDQVKLMGSVSRTPGNVEQFNISITPRSAVSQDTQVHEPK